MARFSFTSRRLRVDPDEASSSGDDGFNSGSDDAEAAATAADLPGGKLATVDAQKRTFFRAADGKPVPSPGRRQGGVERCETRGPHKKARLQTAPTPSQTQRRQVEHAQRRPRPRPVSRLAASRTRTSLSSHTEVSGATSATAEKPKVIVMRGDPTDWSAAAIVNDANSSLQHDAGLAAAIVRAGGWEIQRQCIEWVYYNGQVPVGSAMWTTAHRLSSRFVIHAVGPSVGGHRWPTLQHQLELRQAVRSALTVVGGLGVTSVTIPAISTGTSGYPKHLAAQDIVAECLAFCDDCTPTTLRLIVLMNEDEATTSIFSQALKEQRQLKRQ